MRFHALTVYILLISLLATSSRLIASPAYPPDRPALTVQLSSGQRFHLSLNELETLPQQTLITHEPNLHAPIQWTGVPLSYVLEHFNEPMNSYSALRLEALNNYSVIIPREDLQKYQPIIAFLRDGKSMSVTDSGPLYLIYPFESFAELNQQKYFNRSIWQLSKISVIAE